MTTRKKIGYWVGGIVAGGGITTALLSFDVNALLATLAANAGLIGLIGVLYQLLRDEAAHQKVVWLQHDDQSFQVGATSHMANTVFDKHVEFSEEYVAEVQRTIDTLVREHANAEAMTHANALYAIRRRHATWVTLGMSKQLETFEQTLRRMGARAHFLDVTTDSEKYKEKRDAAIDEIFSTFEDVMPQLFQRDGEDGIAIESIIQRVRCMLGIEELVEMRGLLIKRAHTSLTDD